MRQRVPAQLHRDARAQRHHRPIHLPAPHQFPQRLRNIQKKKRPEEPDVFFVRQSLANHSRKQSHQRRRRRHQPPVISKRRQAQHRPAQQPHHPPADESHQKRAGQADVKKLISNETQHHRNRDRRREEQQQKKFLVRVALFGEQHAAKLRKPHQQRSQRRRKANLRSEEHTS